MNGRKLKKLAETDKCAVKIKTSDTNGTYAVKAYIDGKWTSVTADDLAKVSDHSL